jgi:hypothetical protein
MPVHLFKRKRIEKALIALDMKRTGQSTIQIGKLDHGRFRNKDEAVKDLAWVKVNSTDDLKWRALMNNVYYNRSEFAGIKIDDKTVVDDGFKNIAVFDSFYPGINLPVLEWKRLYEMEQKELAKKNITLKCNFQSTYTCFYEGECKPEHFATFAFNFVKDRAYIIKPRDYLISTTNKNGQVICQIGV